MQNLLTALRLKKELRSYVRKQKKWAKKYPDYTGDEYDCGPLKYVWGIKSTDDLTSHPACWNTLNDLDIYYNRETKKYFYQVECIYRFKTLKDEAEYLKGLLRQFGAWLDSNHYKLPSLHYHIYDEPIDQADSLEELFIKFSIFVYGFYVNAFSMPVD